MKQEVDLVTVAEASREFRVAVSTLYEHMKTGSLTRHTRKGGRPRVFLDRRQLRALFSPTPEKKARKRRKP
jgi:predicted site-specific integrase-resolvase